MLSLWVSWWLGRKKFPVSPLRHQGSTFDRLHETIKKKAIQSVAEITGSWSNRNLRTSMALERILVLSR